MMSAKFATLGHPEVKDILKYLKFFKDYEIIISFHVFTNKVLSPDSNYIVDAVM